MKDEKSNSAWLWSSAQLCKSVVGVDRGGTSVRKSLHDGDMSRRERERTIASGKVRRVVVGWPEGPRP